MTSFIVQMSASDCFLQGSESDTAHSSVMLQVEKEHTALLIFNAGSHRSMEIQFWKKQPKKALNLFLCDVLG